MAEQRVSVSTAEIQRYLGGIDYPANREDLINHARKNSAPEEVISVLSRIEEREFHSAADVNQAIGKIE
ncbi:DUF2795 domain-containing protein [Methanoculleus sp. 7T]|jgi:hypothetical protein|uniref:DUF2795 domain-containing protein n=1 Tax=Methanoculleus sp. 7T TaxID=2937282 RepID=UPI0020C10687|nr:DUF2795 domain-containing protein [Methanoculleus sp. 7T]MCK8519663.1 DUF2795 domain-containing protein [Methanoculleus sp. 7T]